MIPRTAAPAATVVNTRAYIITSKHDYTTFTGVSIVTCGTHSVSIASCNDGVCTAEDSLDYPDLTS